MSKNFWIERSRNLHFRVIKEIREYLERNLFSPVDSLQAHLERKFPGHMVAISPIVAGELVVTVGAVVVTISLL